jgi:DNA-directed RNA polymerase specialized sigma24 family protein
MAPEQLRCAHLEAPGTETGETTFVDRDSAVVVEDDLTRRALAYARKGDLGGLHFLYVRHADDLTAYLEAIVQEREAAEQIVDEVFANLPVVLAGVEERRFSFPASVVRMATNMAVETVRRRKVVPLRDPCANGSRPGRRTLAHALARLSSEERDVLVLRHAAGLSPAHSAKVLDTDESSLALLYERARSSFAAMLGEPGGDPLAARA